MTDLPPVERYSNLKLLGHSDLGGTPNVGEGLATMVRGPQRFLFVAHESSPTALTVLDVTDPRDPRVCYQLPSRTPALRGNSLALFGDVLAIAWECFHGPAEGVGLEFFDVSNPSSPRSIAFWDATGGVSRGVHLVTWFDENTVHLATGTPDFRPRHPKDDQFCMALDVSDPTTPKEIWRWWLPGQAEGDDAPPLTRHRSPAIEYGYRPHHVIVHPSRPGLAWIGYIDGGVVVLDLSKEEPSIVSRWDYSPPFPGFTHTALPIVERDLLIVTDESIDRQGKDWPKRVWVVDVRDPTNPVPLSTLPVPEEIPALLDSGRRVGPHNIHENEPHDGAAHLVNTMAATWFSGGVGLYDISDPFEPEEMATFLPVPPPGQPSSLITDVYVDDRGIVFAGDRMGGGIYILEYAGSQPLT